MEKAYNPKEHEDKIYKLWEESGFFNPDNLPDADKRKPFTIVLPPPNVTGTLHIGQAYEETLQDIMIRFKRMRGFKALWVPGTDHAAIATQAKVEKEIYKKEGKSRHDFGREEFLRRVTDFALESQNTILNQLRKMGFSLDWSRLAFTLDEPRAEAVFTAFKRMYDAGLIYRGYRVVNWDPKGQTTVSDDEVIHQATRAKLYTFRYDKNFPIAIATTRPETKLGDTAVAVHPNDKRYKKFIGKTYKANFAGVVLEIKIIADEAVDPESGTGAVGVTPAHSMTDWEIGERHNLPLKQVINEFAKITGTDTELDGKKTLEAREEILAWLESQNLLEKTEEIDQNIATAERTGAVIEPLPKLQWFVNVNKEFVLENSKLEGIAPGSTTTLKEIMRQSVSSGQIEILPEQFTKRYFHWVDNLRDWCISRQIWFGHRIPVWYCGGIEKGVISKMGVHGTLVEEWLKGKARTYRLQDHGLAVGQRIAFENSATKTLIGYGVITEIHRTTVGEIELPDMKHSGKYKTANELIAAFQRMHPEKDDIAPETPVLIYDFEFQQLSEKNTQNGCGQVIVSKKKPEACPACGGEKLEQDPDTLDTWFSSGLWTFSTLGWPRETQDLKSYHPTDVMNPGYEILYLWVSRMIFLSGFLLGEIPFRKAVIHGIVRDKQGRKFSKSSGIGGNPLEVIGIYGTDALRIALVSGVAMGNDPTFEIEKVKGMKHFANKLWNISRFILMNLQNNESGIRNNEKPKPITGADKEILEKLDITIKEVTENIENFRFHEAAQNIYQFTWHKFADIYIEQSKEQFKDESLKGNTQAILHYSLSIILKLLHPFMPFVTEVIYQKLPGKKEKSLMVERWPA